MTTAIELFQSGKLSAALAVATEAVRNQPSDIVARSQLSELLCFTGDLERADKQLDAAMQIDTEAAVGVSLLRHLIRSEKSRREVFSEGRVPEFLQQPTDAQQSRLKAVLNLRDGNLPNAAELVATALESESQVSGDSDGRPFEGMTDLDDLLGPTIEIYTATGKYYWLSVEQVISIDFSPIEHLSDMLWRAAQIETVGEVSGRIHIPALYHNSYESDDDRIRIGQATDWIQRHESLTSGIGQREWLLGDDVATITSLKSVSFQLAVE